jgi:predicted acyltransferase
MTRRIERLMAETHPPQYVSGRIESVDALRGFDMLWISGGDQIIRALHRAANNDFTAALDTQFHHVAWEGFRFYDLIFPLFMFIVGVVLPFSLTRRLEQGADRGRIYRHLVRRLFLLILLGLVYNGLLNLNFSELRVTGVLQRIAIGYFFAAIILMNFSIRGQALVTGGILVGYWLILMLVPVPGHGAGNLTPEGNLVAFIDQKFLPKPWCCYEYGDNEGLLSMIPAIATTMMGVFAGHWLRANTPPARKAKWLAIAGAAALAVGWLWGLVFPIIKNIWTSSYVIYSGGWSLLLLALFYYVIDVRGWRRWAYFFTIIGLNAITIYVLRSQFDFYHVAHIFVRGFIGSLGEWQPVARAFFSMLAGWCFLWFLHRQKIYLKV